LLLRRKADRAAAGRAEAAEPSIDERIEHQG
jgi:hypothetical protein